MKTPFDKVIEGAKRAQAGMDAAVIDQVQVEEKAAIQIQAEQMYDGQRGDGREILPRYTPFTVEIKRQRRQPYDRVTLRDTGDFQDAIVIDYGPDSFRYDSTDNKRARLVRKYGEQIFGLNDANLDKLIDTIRDGFIERVQKTILNA